MAKVKLPAGPQEVTPEWLTFALRENGTIGAASVTSIDYEVIGEGVGVLGQLARIRPTYESAEDGAPASIVAKFPATTQENRDLANLFRFYEREVRFYEEIADEVELRTPERYYSHFDHDTCDYVLLMEDLHPARCGDQVAGCSPDEAATLIREMARFHASWWDNPQAPDWIPLGNDPVHQSAEKAYQDCFPYFLNNFGDRISARALAVAERLAPKIIAIQHAITRPPFTIAHGDLRYDNLFFGHDGMAVADWQIIVRTRGPYDVGYFLSQSIDPEKRRATEMEILRGYHETLLEHGVKDYSFDDCFNDYRACAMFCLVYPVISGGTLDLANERGTELVTAMLTRSLETILDLDCDEMIPA